jgi:hypothetical protein
MWMTRFDPMKWTNNSKENEEDYILEKASGSQQWGN